MNILVISSNYPSSGAPQQGTFVYKLIQQFVAEQHKVVVISPHKFTASNKAGSYGKEGATVYRPRKLSFSNIKIGPVNTFHWTNYAQAHAIKKTVKKITWEHDVVYCHFIISAINYFQAFPTANKPVFVAVGEYHNIDVVRKNFSAGKYLSFLNKIKGFIAVSPQIREKLIALGVPSEKIIVEPNATDLNKFKSRNKEELRIKHRLPLDKKIILFVGRFIENKGPLRVVEALDSLGDDVVAVFIGKGIQEITHPKIIFSGAMNHDSVAEYMSLSDVFVLPTLHEGSSNVIVEAMASGLPIVSSDIPEVKVQCRPEYSILVDPMSAALIAAALNTVLKDDELRITMSQEALKASKYFDIRQRANRILAFLQS